MCDADKHEYDLHMIMTNGKWKQIKQDHFMVFASTMHVASYIYIYPLPFTLSLCPTVLQPWNSMVHVSCTLLMHVVYQQKIMAFMSPYMAAKIVFLRFYFTFSLQLDMSKFKILYN